MALRDDVSNPENYKHRFHWEAEEVQIIAAGQAGEQNLGSGSLTLDKTVRINELTLRNSGTADTVISLLVLSDAVYRVKVSIICTADSSVEWESDQGRKYIFGEQPIVRASVVTGGTIYISGSGIEASVVNS